MAWQECDNYEEIIEGKVYLKQITMTAGADGLNNRSVMYNIANGCKSLLDSLPDGYRCTFVAINGQAPTSGYIYGTTGTSHSFTAQTQSSSISSSGTAIETIKAYSNTWGDVLARYVQITSAGAITNTDIIGSIVVSANASYTANVYYTLSKA